MTPEKQPELTPEERRNAMFRMAGLIAGLFSKSLLEAAGCEVNYKINGEPISIIENLTGLDISERIKLAVAEERYEDAANLKKLLDAKRALPDSK